MKTTILQGNALDVLPTLPADSFHCVVTSPPFYALRTYGTEPQTWPDGWTGELGSEPTVELYVEHLVAIFREVRRVLRPDGVCWVELGDSYNSNPSWGRGQSTLQGRPQCGMGMKPDGGWLDHARVSNCKPGDLLGVPWQVALALRDDGWFLRSDCIWHKRAPMPSSVDGWRWTRCQVKVRPRITGKEKWTSGSSEHPQGESRHVPEKAAQWADCPGCEKCTSNDGLILRKGAWRPTTAHSYLFMLAKSRRYFCDREAVADEALTAGQPIKMADGWDTGAGSHGTIHRAGREKGKHNGQVQASHANPRTVWSFTNTLEDVAAQLVPEDVEALADWLAGRLGSADGAVWILKQQGFSGEHYATFPPSLPDKCIRAACSEKGCCPACGAQWARVVEKSENPAGINGGEHREPSRDGALGTRIHDFERERLGSNSRTLGFRPTCTCDADKSVSCRVLDPFGGAGTTAVAANRLGHDATLIELSAKSVEIAVDRLRREFGLLADVETKENAR